MEYNNIDNLFTYKICDMISNKNMNPNIITLLNIIPSVLSIYFLYKNELILFFIFLIIRIFLDCLDGHVARKYNKVTHLGQMLDKYTDIIFYLVLLLVILRNYNLSIKICISILFIGIIGFRINIPIITNLFDIIESNTIISIPLLCLIIIKINNIFV